MIVLTTTAVIWNWSIAHAASINECLINELVIIYFLSYHVVAFWMERTMHVLETDHSTLPVQKPVTLTLMIM